MLERKFSYRNSKSRDEIVKKLQEKLSTECSFSLWQKDETGKRKFVEKIRFHTLFAGDGVFTVFADQKEMAVFDRERDIYFILEGHDFVFKTKVALEQKSFFTFQIPKEIQLKEHRGEPRVYFSPNERKTVEVSFFLKEIDQQHSIQCPLLNISSGGMCLIITKETLSTIDLKRDVMIHEGAEVRISCIRNARVYKKKSLNQDELYAIGVQFKN